jgi:hypothetical protein
MIAADWRTADHPSPMNLQEKNPYVICNQLLPYGVKGVPEHIMKAAGQYEVDRHLRGMIMTMIGLEQPLDTALRRRLAWRPALLGDLLDTELVNPEELHQIIRSPYQAMGLVAHRPYFLPYFQSLILDTPETAEQLFFLRKRVGDEMGLDDQRFVQVLEPEPNRRQRLLAVLDETACARDIAAVYEQADSRRYTSAAWACEWLARHLPADDRPLEPRLAEVIAQDEAYLYLSMLTLRNAVLDPAVWRPLVERVTSPRWAYHCLRSGLVVPPGHADEMARLQQLLVTDPGWLVEWLIDTRQPMAEIRRYYLLGAETAFEHERIGDLHHWFQTLTLLPAVRRMAAAASG